MSALIAKRARVIKTLTRLEEFALTVSSETTLYDLRGRNESLESLLFQFNQIDDEILGLEELPEDRESVIETFEAMYYRVRSTYDTLIAERNPPPPTHNNDLLSSTLNNTLGAELVSKLLEQQNSFLERLHNTPNPKQQFATFNTDEASTKIVAWDISGNSFVSNSTNNVRLPVLDIPSFSGSYQEWKSFYDAFNGAVHENDNLRSNQKFRYLKGFLKGEPLSLIKHLETTDANYTEAWSKLQNRYNKPNHIIQSMINSFFDIEAVKSSSASDELRHIWSKADEVIRGLRVVGPKAESRDPWLISILLSKVDKDTHHAWAEHALEKGMEFPIISDFLEFLNSRCDAFESCKSPVAPMPQASPRLTPKPSKVHTVNLTQCPRCGEHHHLSYCPKFSAENVSSRRQFVAQNNLCFNCLRKGHSVRNCKSKINCSDCNKRHHSLIHPPYEAVQYTVVKSNQRSSEQPRYQSTSHVVQSEAVNFAPNRSADKEEVNLQPSHVHIVSQQSLPQTNKPSLGKFESSPKTLNATNQITTLSTTVVLPTAQVRVKDHWGNLQYATALLDSGSQSTLISESCVQRLGLSRTNTRIPIHGLAENYAGTTRGKVTVEICSRFDHKLSFTASALILSNLTTVQPAFPINSLAFSQLDNMPLADPDFRQPKVIDLLLGADLFFSLITNGRIQASDGMVIATNSTLGWIVAGRFECDPKVTCHAASIDTIDELLQKFWETETVPENHQRLTDEEIQAENCFSKQHFRDELGRYHVRLPFVQGGPNLGESFRCAYNRFLSLERRLAKDSKFLKNYSDFMEEYLQMGHMELIMPTEINQSQVYYLPHHGVLKESSLTTKLRVVFNASSKTTNGKSLNDNLLTGPVLQKELPAILLRFRCHRHAFTADIEKMFRMIGMQNCDKDYQRIIWRPHPDQPLQHYRLSTVTYGTTPAPFLSIRVLQQLSFDEKLNFPLAANVLANDFYVDDCMSGGEDFHETKALIVQLNNLLRKGGFRLRKWASNTEELLTDIAPEDRLNSVMDLSNDLNIPVLGVFWNPKSDFFSFRIILSSLSPVSKRRILSDVARIFDPLGWVSPTIIVAKCLLQQLWLLKLDWDDELPTSIVNKWNTLRDQLPRLNEVKVPRVLFHAGHQIQWHGFCDASSYAFAAVIYCRSTDLAGITTINIVAAKTKVAPLKPTSIPRLELCAALLLSKLFGNLQASMAIDCNHIYCWTDSKVVLAWLSSHPSRWKQFVANRVSQIMEILPVSKWKYVHTKMNPADCTSRGVLPSDLPTHPLWWSGPTWLTLHQTSWPTSEVNYTNLKEEERCTKQRATVLTVLSPPKIVLEEEIKVLCKLSSWSRLYRTLAYVLRFITCLKEKEADRTPLKVLELTNAKLYLFRFSQTESFAEDLKELSKHGYISTKSKLRSLHPFLDENQLLRVGGRLENSRLPFATKHPIILHKSSYFVELIVREMHIIHLHSGVTTLLAILRQTYWIIGARDLVKKVVHKCTTCYRYAQHNRQQLMGNLPSHRLDSIHAFYNTGCDFAGPFLIRNRNGKGARHTKGYVALFICMSTRAVHLELVGDLSSDAFIAALRRFISRRGLCAHVYTDNGSNFVGAARKLGELHRLISTHHCEFADYLSSRSIQWHFIPPSAPHFGGMWESGVKSMKYHMMRVVGLATYTFEEMTTLLSQIEAILNSRPICAVTESDDMEYLTPGHFLIGRPITAIPEPDLVDMKPSYLNRWKLVQQASQGFWLRWKAEYITSIQQRPKWCNVQENVKVNDIVLLKDDTRQPTYWNIGKIIAVHPGADKLVRVVTVRTQAGTFKRPIGKIAVLPSNC